jgi:hypothetical protein
MPSHSSPIVTHQSVSQSVSQSVIPTLIPVSHSHSFSRSHSHSPTLTPTSPLSSLTPCTCAPRCRHLCVQEPRQALCLQQARRQVQRQRPLRLNVYHATANTLCDQGATPICARGSAVQVQIAVEGWAGLGLKPFANASAIMSALVEPVAMWSAVPLAVISHLTWLRCCAVERVAGLRS